MVDSIRGIKELCQGEDVFLSIEVSGTSLYSYKWVKMSDRSMLFKDSAVLEIQNCGLSDTSRYYCEVKDIKNGTVRFSDTIDLVVLAHPEIRFSLQLQDTFFEINRLTVDDDSVFFLKVIYINCIGALLLHSKG